MPVWLVFLLSAAAVIAAGARLSRDGDALAERTGLGGAWVGAILVAGATSLPELATGFFAIRNGEVNLAVGDIFGSSMANLCILAVADLTARNTHVLSRVTINQMLVAALGITLAAIAVAGILSPVRLTFLNAGWSTWAIAVTYVLGMRLLHINRGQAAFLSEGEAVEYAESLPSTRAATIGFIASAVVILIAARFLASSSEELAHQMGVSTGFVGIVLVALTTSLPEVTVSIAAVRMGSYDLAVGNLLGSNCFNAGILFIHDLVDGPGSLMARVDPQLLLGGVFGMILTGQVMMGIMHRPEKRNWLLEPNAILLLLTYLLGLGLVYQAGLK